MIQLSQQCQDKRKGDFLETAAKLDWFDQTILLIDALFLLHQQGVRQAAFVVLYVIGLVTLEATYLLVIAR